MERPTYDELLAENARLRRQVDALTQQIRDLTRRLEAAEAAAKRQAAPFSKRPPVANPKRPGRKSGSKHGQHGHRPPLADDAIDEDHDVPLPCQCPHCGGPVDATHTDQQDQTELPDRPVRRRFHIGCGRCRKCGRAVRGRHPLQTSDATGAAGSQLGANAQAAVVYLNKHAGLSHGKVADVMTNLLRVPLSRGGSARIVLRASRKLEPVYEQIGESIADSDYLTPDETGWRVGGRPAWNHVWVGDVATCYAIDPRRSANALEKAIGVDWSGVLTHDGYASYDRFTEAVHQQCAAHLLRRARALEERQRGPAQQFPRQVIDLFKAALATRDAFEAGQVHDDDLLGLCEDYTERLAALTNRRRPNADNERLAKHLRNHLECWFSFVANPETPATNWKAEQALRPAVVNRKVWGGNRTWVGAHAQEVLMSVIQTCKQQTISALEYIGTAIRGVVQRLIPE